MNNRKESLLNLHTLIPPCFRIEISEHTNQIRQLATPAWEGDATFEPLAVGRKRGFMIKPTDGSPETILITNGSKPPTHAQCSLRLRCDDAEITKTPSLDLSAAQWIEHPLKDASLTKLADFELVGR